MSFAPEVIADSSGQWAGNSLRFATREEAEANVRDLSMRWFAVRETRVKITGRNRAEIKDYLHELFHYNLTQEVEAYPTPTEKTA